MLELKNKGPLNAYQRHACASYADGDHAWIADIADTDELWAQIGNVGDTLFVYVTIELSTEEGCEDADTAFQRIEQSVKDLQGMLVGASFQDDEEAA